MLSAHSGDQVVIPLSISPQGKAANASTVNAAPSRILAAKERGQ